MSRHAWRPIALVALLLAASWSAAAQTASDTASGRRVEFPLTRFNDTLFAAYDAAGRATFDEAGDVWYTSQAGVVHIDLATMTRETYTKMDGLPSSYSMGIHATRGKVYVGTDLGVAIIDRATRNVSKIDFTNSPIRDIVVQDVRLVGDELWMAGRFFGVAAWNTTRPLDDEGAWTFKNTSISNRYAQPVRRITETPTAIWFATEGDGAWRFDRANRTWNVTLRADGLVANVVLSIAERGTNVYFGTENGLQRRATTRIGTPEEWLLYNESHGMPDDRVFDVDVIPTASKSVDVFAATRRGVWQLNPETGQQAVRNQSFGILGGIVLDNTWDASRGWLFGTTRGVSLYRDPTWSYFTTGPSVGPSQGPLSYGFTSGSVGNENGFLWFGSNEGVSAYRLPTGDDPGFWQNFGEWQRYPGGVVNHIDVENGTTWIASNLGAYGFDQATGRWISKISGNSRNLVYGLEADRGELWVALFGDGLVMENLTTGQQRFWKFENSTNRIPDNRVTDVRAEGNTIWLGATVGVIRMDRVSGSVVGTYTTADGIPGDGVVFRTIPEGPLVWVGTKNGGVARFDVATGKVTQVWNATNTPGFPGGEVRSLLREGGRLWVGTEQGLARIDVVTGQTRAWNQSSSPLVQNIVNGLVEAEGVLYIATLSGVARMDISTGEFFPMRDGPGVARGAQGSSTTSARVSVRIDAPRDGAAFAGATEVRGSALSLGGKVDRVEVRVGEGAWTPANGAESWTFTIDAATLPANVPITLAARAVAGNATSREAEILLTPVAAPKVPLTLDAVPLGNATAGRPIPVAARATGDDPLAAYLYYLAPGASAYQRLPLVRQGALFTGSIPARDVREGELRYYFEAQSGLLAVEDEGSADAPTRLAVAPTPRLAVAIEGPAQARAPAGATTTLVLNVTNAGTQPASFTLSASGLRATWLTVPQDPLDLKPGETRPVSVRITVPEKAFGDNTTLTFEAQDVAGEAEAATARVPVEIVATSATPATSTPASGKGIPFPGALALVAVAATLALLRRRRA